MSEEYFTEHDDEPRLLISKAKFNQIEKDLKYYQAIYNTLIDGAAKDRDRINELTETIKEINEWYEDEFDKRELLESKLTESERKLGVAVKGLEFYAHVNNPNDLGSWDMRKPFVFDIIQEDDCDQAHYDIDKYRFGGKRAREFLAAIKEQGEKE